NLRMKELVDRRELGRVLMVRRRHGLATHTWPDFADSWHVKPELNRGMWADDASHAVDFIYWLLGMPHSVVAEIGTLVNPNVPDDNGVAVFRYEGALAEVGCSFTCMTGENTTEITCENGVIIQNYGDAVSCGAPRQPGAVGLKWFVRGDKQWTDSGIPSPESHGARIAGLAPELLAFCQGRRGPIATARQGRDVLAMTLACYRSSEGGRRIALS
ncbi:MAG: Gfo/Idh/MocA family oxidoreductase, partial [Phycisphaeraceae bacterium]|nr:Gfo/Idh/MocA family oxidoreductase [Phycisphaeraceae bacterium]